MIAGLCAAVLAASDGGSSVLQGPVGVDETGYSRQWVDKLVLQQWLRERQFSTVERELTALLVSAEKDVGREQLAFDGLLALSSGEPEVKAALDAWVKQRPGAFAAWAARGAWFVQAAFAARGVYSWADTPEEARDAMERNFLSAERDLDRAIKLRPAFYLAAAFQQQIAMAGSSHGRRWQAERLAWAEKLQPGTWLVRRLAMASMVPRWGGSYELMAAFAAGLPASKYPRLKWLSGYAFADQCDRERDEKACKLALEYGPDPETLITVAEMQLKGSSAREAIATLDRVLSQHGHWPGPLVVRAEALAQLERWEEAAASLRLAQQISPTYWEVTWALEKFVPRLLEAAEAQLDYGDARVALERAELAVDLAPNLGRAYAIRARAAKKAGATVDPKDVERACKLGFKPACAK